MAALPQTPPDAEARAEAAAKPAPPRTRPFNRRRCLPSSDARTICSCFSYLPVAAALWAHGARGRFRPDARAYAPPAQAAISFLADSVEFLSRGSGGKWQAIDRVWAACASSLAVAFVRGSGSSRRRRRGGCRRWRGHARPRWRRRRRRRSRRSEAVLARLGAGTPRGWPESSLRVTTAPVTWALCHITWHVVPAMAGANLLAARRVHIHGPAHKPVRTDSALSALYIALWTLRARSGALFCKAFYTRHSGQHSARALCSTYIDIPSL